MTGLLDTNVALYLLGGRLAAPLSTGSYGISVITEMELLAWPSLTTEEEKKGSLSHRRHQRNEDCSFARTKSALRCLRFLLFKHSHFSA